MEQEKRQLKLEIKLDEDIAQGLYCNMAVFNHNQNEFIVDFIFVQPQEPKAKVRARVITSPAHMKRLARVMGDNLMKYEQKYGVIDLSEALPGEQ